MYIKTNKISMNLKKNIFIISKQLEHNTIRHFVPNFVTNYKYSVLSSGVSDPDPV